MKTRKIKISILAVFIISATFTLNSWAAGNIFTFYPGAPSSNLEENPVAAVNLVTSIPGNANSKVQDCFIFPNPSNGKIHIEFLSPCKDCKIQISNSHGASILKKAISNNFTGRTQIDLGEYPSGIYFVNILSNNKSENSKFKVILNK
jgi:hypothetical protein